MLASKIAVCACLILYCNGAEHLQEIKFKSPNLISAVNEIINKFYSKRNVSPNMVCSTKEFKTSIRLKHFTNELLLQNNVKNISKIAFRLEGSDSFPATSVRRRRCTIITIETFSNFLNVYDKILPDYFRFNGFFLIVLLKLDYVAIEEIFRLMWQRQIYNVNIVYENEHGKVNVKTFMPFNSNNCNDTTPVLINEYVNGEFVNDIEKFYPDKMGNLHNCQIRIATSKVTEPYIIVDHLSDGNQSLRGRDIFLVAALSQSLNFKMNFTYIGHEGYLYENRSTSGVFKELNEGRADLGVCDLWLKAIRLKYFDSTSSYISEKITFIIPPGREFQSFEILILPFSIPTWIVVLASYFIGVLVIFIVKKSPQNVQRFVFGINVRHPYLNMFAATFGGAQYILPRNNFGRFLLMLFLMYSLVIRTVYQGFFYHLLQSSDHHQEVRSVDEMIEEDFKFYIFDYMWDSFQNATKIRSRYFNIKLISLNMSLCNSFRVVSTPYDHKVAYFKNVADPKFKGTIAFAYTEYLYEVQRNTPKFRICKEIFMTIPSVIYTPKDFYLVDALSEMIEAYKAAGLIEHWHSKSFYKTKSRDSQSPQVIKLRHLEGCFEEWLVGLLLSFMVFIMEVMFSLFSN